jgi:hypothetical protein
VWILGNRNVATVLALETQSAFRFDHHSKVIFLHAVGASDGITIRHRAGHTLFLWIRVYPATE